MKNSKGDRTLFQKNLLAWYRKSHRPHPWRQTRDPYRIWISEILLQQTRVNTAIAFYDRFLARFPSLTDLAEAPIEAVLQVWQGLGYYGRARNLHRAARLIAEEFNGMVPDEPEVLQTLPGIGPYTAAAIASIAFDKDTAVLDGNVARVLCRACGIRGAPTRSSTKKRLKGLADRLLPRGHAAEFNQAVMELGALICKPARPECPVCPVKHACVANRLGLADRLPSWPPRPRLPVRVRLVAAVAYRGRLLFERRALEGFLGGLWELPGIYLEGKEGSRQGFRRLEKQLGDRLSVQRIPEGEDFSVKHVYSHFEESNQVFVCEGAGGSNRGRRGGTEQTYRWIHPARLEPYPITGATRKILRRLEQTGTKP